MVTENRLQLPFSLPCDLQVTSYRRESGSHATGKAIDFAPILTKETEAGQVGEYVGAYSELFAHMQYGVLRINKSTSCWHYHYQADYGRYESGFEQYARGTKMVNGKPVSACVKFGDIYTINHKKMSGAWLKFSKMLSEVSAAMFGYSDFLATFSPSYWKAFFSQVNQSWRDRATFVYYNSTEGKEESRISTSELQTILNGFSGDYALTFVSLLREGSPEDQRQRDIDRFITIGVIGLAAYIIIRDK